MGGNLINTYIVDTNVILNNPLFYTEFNNCMILIPIYVFEELDQIKTREGGVGYKARRFFREFKKIESRGSLLKGIELENNVIVKSTVARIEVPLPEFLDPNYADNKILALMLNPDYKDAKLITHDVSMRIKASSLGINCLTLDASDKHKLSELYSGVIQLKVETDLIQKFYQDKFLTLEDLNLEKAYPNQFLTCKTEYSYESIKAIYNGTAGGFVPLKRDEHQVFGIKPLDIQQNFAMEALLDKNIQLVTIASKQGCGKTFLALAAALELTLEHSTYEKIILGKNTTPIDKWSYQGFTTGDTTEKLLTHFGNFTTTLENISDFKGKSKKKGIDLLLSLIEGDKVEVLDVSSILGSSFNNKIIILDEAQSFDEHAMRSIISRIGKGSKLILIGDIGQQTIARISPDKSGLYIAIEWLKELEETAHITLKSVHRSSFVEKASHIFDEKMFS